MKTIKRGTLRRLAVIAAIAVFVTAQKTSAIEGLKISVQCSNVVLHWPIADNENYIIQYRQTLQTNTPWQFLETYLYPDWGTNVTYYIHSNVVQNVNCGGSMGM